MSRLAPPPPPGFVPERPSIPAPPAGFVPESTTRTPSPQPIASLEHKTGVVPSGASVNAVDNLRGRSPIPAPPAGFVPEQPSSRPQENGSPDYSPDFHGEYNAETAKFQADPTAYSRAHYQPPQSHPVAVAPADGGEGPPSIRQDWTLRHPLNDVARRAHQRSGNPGYLEHAAMSGALANAGPGEFINVEEDQAPADFKARADENQRALVDGSNSALHVPNDWIYRRPGGGYVVKRGHAASRFTDAADALTPIPGAEQGVRAETQAQLLDERGKRLAAQSRDTGGLIDAGALTRDERAKIQAAKGAAFATPRPENTGAEDALNTPGAAAAGVKTIAAGALNFFGNARPNPAMYGDQKTAATEMGEALGENARKQAEANPVDSGVARAAASAPVIAGAFAAAAGGPAGLAAYGGLTAGGGAYQAAYNDIYQREVAKGRDPESAKRVAHAGAVGPAVASGVAGAVLNQLRLPITDPRAGVIVNAARHAAAGGSIGAFQTTVDQLAANVGYGKPIDVEGILTAARDNAIISAGTFAATEGRTHAREIPPPPAGFVPERTGAEPGLTRPGTMQTPEAQPGDYPTRVPPPPEGFVPEARAQEKSRSNEIAPETQVAPAGATENPAQQGGEIPPPPPGFIPEKEAPNGQEARPVQARQAPGDGVAENPQRVEPARPPADEAPAATPTRDLAQDAGRVAEVPADQGQDQSGNSGGKLESGGTELTDQPPPTPRPTPGEPTGRRAEAGDDTSHQSAGDGSPPAGERQPRDLLAEAQQPEPVRPPADQAQEAKGRAGDALGEGGAVGSHAPQDTPAEPRPLPPTRPGPVPKSPPETKPVPAKDRKPLEDQLRHLVATDPKYYEDLTHQRAATDPGESNRQRGFQKSATVGQRVRQGSLDPKALVTIDQAKEMARTLPADHPAQVVLRKLEGFEAGDRGDGPTSLKNAVTDKERARHGLPEAEKAGKRAFGDVWDTAKRDLDENPDLSRDLVDSLRSRPRALTDHEDALLLHRQVDLQRQYREVAEQIIKEGEADSENMPALKARMAAIQDNLLDVYNVGKAAGTETGRGLAARRQMAKEDFSLAAMEVQKRAALGGRTLSAEESAGVKALHEKIQSTQKAFDDYVKVAEERHAEQQSRITHERMRSATAEMALEKLQKEGKPGPAPKNRITALDKIAQAGDAAQERLRKKFFGKDTGRLNDIHAVIAAIPDLTIWGAGELAKLTKKTGKAAVHFYEQVKSKVHEMAGDDVLPHFAKIWEGALKMHDAAASEAKRAVAEKLKGVVKDGAVDPANAARYIQKMARDAVAAGVTDRNKLIDAVHDQVKDVLPDWDRRKTMDAISGYGQFKQLSKDEVSVKLRGLKGELQQVAKLSDMIDKGEAPKKTGVERRTPTENERRLAKEVAETKKRLGIQTTDPASQLKSTLDTIKTRLDNQIKDIEYELSSGRPAEQARTPAPTDPQAEAKRAQLKDLREVRDAVFGEGDKNEAAKARQLQDAITKVNAELAGAEKPAAPEGEKPKDSPHIEALKQRLSDLREQQRQTDGAKVERLTKAAERQLKFLEDQVTLAKGGVFKSREPKAAQAWGEAIKARRDALRAELDMLKADAGIPEQVALAQYKARTTARIAELNDRVARGDFAPAPARKPLALDAEATRLAVAAERAREEFRHGVLRDQQKNRTRGEKALDFWVKVRRAEVLSSPVTIVKLAAAAVQRGVFTPIEEVVGGGFSKAFPALAGRAPREGGFSVKAEAKAFAATFTSGMKDAAEMVKGRESPLTVLHGEKQPLPPHWLDYMGQLHGALKSPIKRNEFQRSLQKRMEHAIREGFDVTDPFVMARLSKDAYIDANRAIFMQDNRLVSAVRSVTARMRAPDPITGKPSLGMSAGAAAIDTFMPIVKVPTNIVAETMRHATGLVTGSGRLALAYKAGIGKLSPEHADSIMRDLKKGSLGLAVMALGFFGAKDVGGLYQQGEKRDPEDVKAGTIRVFGQKVPKVLLHSPLMESLQIGATIRRVADSKHRKSDQDTQGVGAGAMAAAFGLVEEMPYMHSAADLAEVLNENTRDQAVGRQAQSLIVPAAVQFAAQAGDRRDEEGNPVNPAKGAFGVGETVKRKPQGIAENIKMGIPGLRSSVPEKVEVTRTQTPAQQRQEATKSTNPMAGKSIEEAIPAWERMGQADKAKYRNQVLAKINEAKIPIAEKAKLRKRITS